MVSEVAYYLLMYVIPYLLVVWGLGFPIQTWIIHYRWWPEFHYREVSDFALGVLLLISPLTAPIVLTIELMYIITRPLVNVCSYLGAYVRENIL